MIALTMCRVMGWTMDYVMSLTWPQFEEVSFRLERLQYITARNEIFFGVSAALNGEDAQQNLFSAAGKMILDAAPEYTEADMAAARKRLEEAMKENEQNGKES